MFDLSIGIPTYNGSKTIRTVIDKIVENATNDKIKCEIIISNNNSTDDTFNIINSIESTEFCKIIINNNSENLGYDGNCHKCIEYATANYIWLCSDNEVLVDDHGLKKIINCIKKYSPEFLYLHHDTELSVDMSKEYFLHGEDFFKATNFSSGLITNCVVKKNTWNDLNIIRYNGCKWIHFAYQLEALAPIRNKNDCCCLYDVIYKSLPTDERWGENGSFIDTGLLLVALFHNNMPRLGYDYETIKLAKMVIKGGYPDNIIKAKALDYRFNEKTIKLMKTYYSDLPFFDKDFKKAIAMPTILCKIIYKLKIIKIKLKSFIK